MIVRFQDDYRFLSNFWPCEVEFEGVKYPTVEHAYQAAKTCDLDWRKIIREAIQPQYAKRIGRKAPLRQGWDDVKLEVMRSLVWQKFSDPYFRNLLLRTGEEILIEGNTWGDTFWGVCNGVGENHLGLILMNIRDRIRARAA